MNNFPQHIIKSLLSNQTSLGAHPAYPPDEELPFILNVVKKYIEKLGVDDNPNDMSLTLQQNINKCRKIESSHKQDLEELCANKIISIFNIPENTIELNNSIQDNIDVSDQRMFPEETEDYSFDSIKDMKELTNEVYKRRMLNALISGASLFYIMQFKEYFSDAFDIDENLPSLYKNILIDNLKLIYLQKEPISNEDLSKANKVDVYMSGVQNIVKINSEAIIFPLLIESDIRGLLELAISHGLPQSIQKSNYIIKKSDFKAAELWDIRLGLPLWECIYKIFKECDCDVYKEGIISYVFFEFAKLNYKGFNKLLQELFKHTKKGKEYIKSLLSRINNKTQSDSFIEYINDERIRYKNESYLTSEELKNLKI